MQRLLLFCSVVVATLALAPSSNGQTTLAGISVPKTISVNGNQLNLNGAGIRSFQLAVIPIRIYVAAFYSPAPVRSLSDAIQSSGPLAFNFTFLRDVDEDDVIDAWTSQLESSVTQPYPGWQADVQRFASAFPAITKGDTQTVQVIGSNVLMLQNGRMLGQISSENFAQAFLSIWFGSNPVTPKLKQQLLGK